MSELVINKSDFIFINIPTGKPEANEICRKSTLFSRKTVERSLPKGNTCYYYALNLIRLRIGKKPSRSYIASREIEIISSNLRKKITQASPFSHKGFIQTAITEVFKICESLSIRPPSAFLDLNLERNYSFRTYLKTKFALMDFVYSNMYNMEPVKWAPLDPIESLIYALNHYGPILVNADIGVEYFSEKAILSEEIESAPIHFCDEKDHMKKLEPTQIVIVGAKKSEGSDDLVYFKDPLDGGIFVYATTYKLFQLKVSNFITEKFLRKDGEIREVYGWQSPC
jgi:hypothetical protein